MAQKTVARLPVPLERPAWAVVAAKDLIVTAVAGLADCGSARLFWLYENLCTWNLRYLDTRRLCPWQVGLEMGGFMFAGWDVRVAMTILRGTNSRYRKLLI